MSVQNLAKDNLPINKTNRATRDVSVADGVRIAVVVVAAYIAAQMLSDIASLKIGLVAGWAVDMGTFIYPITFTLRDVVHKVLGKRNAQLLIIAAAIINLFMVTYLTWAAGVPSDPEALGGPEFSMIFAPLWRIVVASIVAEVISELLDTEVYHWFVTKITRQYQWLRVLVSNAASVPVDNILFALIAFAPFTLLGTDGLPWNIVWQIFIFNLVIKFAVTLLSLPLIYITPDRKSDS